MKTILRARRLSAGGFLVEEIDELGSCHKEHGVTMINGSFMTQSNDLGTGEYTPVPAEWMEALRNAAPGAWLSQWVVEHQLRYGWDAFATVAEARAHQAELGTGAAGIEWRDGVTPGEEWSS